MINKLYYNGIIIPNRYVIRQNLTWRMGRRMESPKYEC